MKQEKWYKIKYQYLPLDKKLMAITASWKTISTIYEGSQMDFDELVKRSEDLLEHFFIFEAMKKPAVKSNIPTKGKVEPKISNDVPF